MNYKRGDVMFRKAFSLYIWLILFTLVISTASIVIFNYVSADIKTSNYFFKNINKSLDLDSYAIAAVEIYKTNQQRNFNFEGFNFQITPVDSSKLLVNIYKGSLCAKYLMQYSIDLGSLNKIVGEDTLFKKDNKYSNTLVATTNFRIQSNADKIFNTLVALPNANITNENGYPLDTKDISKYTNNFITDIDIPNLNETLNQYISNYYRQLYTNFYDKYLNSNKVYEDDNVAFTQEGDLIIKKPATIKIEKISRSRTFDNYLTVFIQSGPTYYFAISSNVFIQGGNPDVFDYTTGKPLETNDRVLSDYYRNRQYYATSLIYDVAKAADFDSKYVCVVTPKKDFVILSLGDITVESTNGILYNFLIITALDKKIIVKSPIVYRDYSTINHSLPSNSKSFIRIIADEIDIDANGANSIDLCGNYVAFYNPTSSINITNAPNDLNLNIFGAFQYYHKLRINGNDIENTNAKEFYYSDPRVEKISDILSLKIYRTQILAKEIIKLPK